MIANFCLDILLFVYPFHLSEGILFKIIAFHKFLTIVNRLIHSSSLKLYKLHIPTTQLVERSTYIAQKAIWINERAVLFCKCKYCFSIAKYHQHPFIIPMVLSSRYWLRNISLIDVSWKFTSTLQVYIYQTYSDSNMIL